MKDILLYVEGMDCEEEARLIKAKMENLKGIGPYEINLMARTLRVTYDPQLGTTQDIIGAIAKTGMKARVKNGVPERKKSWWKEKQVTLLFFCGSFILLAFILEGLGLSHRIAKYIYAMAVLTGGYYPAKMGLVALKTFTPNIRTLMVTGAAGAIGLGLWEEAALLVFIYSLGDVLEVYTVGKTREAVKALMELAPKEALVKKDGQDLILPLERIEVGETIIIRPGEKIPLDGIILSGSSTVDQAPITGESIPVSKFPGEEVLAGSINQKGSLEIKVTKPFKDTTLGKIIHYVQEAEGKKSRHQRFGEKFGKYYTPSMFGLAFLVMTISPFLFGGYWADWFYRGLVVLVVSCSCGIVLSIPVAIVSAITNGARHGVLIKGGVYMETAGMLSAIAFDKTGSLTFGRPEVTEVIPLGNLEEEHLLTLGSSIEARSEHPLAEAIVRRAKERGISIPEVEAFEALPGLGARARMGEVEHYIGSKHLFQRMGHSLSLLEKKLEALEAQGKSLILFGNEQEILGVIALADRLREEARNSIKSLKALGIKHTIMLTGDNGTVAMAMAEDAGLDEYLAELLPEEKVEAVKNLKERYGKVAMVGDGVNDAPAMLASDLGIAMGGRGTDVAIETGDIVLMSDDLSKLPYVLTLSRRTIRNIKENIYFSLAVIAFLVPVALLGWIGLVPGLLINEIGGLLVIINGLRLLR